MGAEGAYDIIVQSVDQQQDIHKEGKRGVQTFELEFSDEQNDDDEMEFVEAGSGQPRKIEPLVPDFENSAGSFELTDHIQVAPDEYDIYKIFNVENQQEFAKFKAAQKKKKSKKRMLW